MSLAVSAGRPNHTMAAEPCDASPTMHQGGDKETIHHGGPSRRRAATRQRRLLLFSNRILARNLVLLLVVSGTLCHAAPFDTCYNQLVNADADGSGTLDETEFATVATELTSGTVTASTAATSTSLVSTYSSFITGVDWSAETSSSSSTVVTACQSLYTSLLQAMNETTVSEQICSVGLMIGDANRNSGLSQDTEYIRFVNYLSGGQYASVTDYSSLSSNLQQVFTDFADTTTGEIDVTGSKPSETPTEEQAAFLQNLCNQAAVGIYSSESGSGTTTAPVASPSTNVPTATSGTTSTPVASSTGDDATTPTFTLQQCSIFLAISDYVRDGILDSNEYVRFINRLTSNQYSSDTYDTLPAELQDNFVALTEDGSDGIDIAGAAPGSSPTDEELAQLETICQSTDEAIQAVSGGGTTDSPVPASAPTASTPAMTSAPTPVASTEIVLEYSRCLQYLAISDLDRDDYLSDTEYLRFLTYASARAISVTDYSQLDPVLQSNYKDLTDDSNSMIDIGGSKPGNTPTAEQTTHLTNVCDSTVDAMNEALNPVTPIPTNAVNGTVYNAWVVSDPNGTLTAMSLRTGQNRKALDDGYATFVEEQFRIFLANADGASRRFLQEGAAPAVYLVDGTTQNYQIDDYNPCPKFASGKSATGNCMKVYSSFVISMANIEKTKLVTDQLMQQTMSKIPTDLQKDITAVYSETPLLVVNADLPLQPPPPAGQDDDAEGDDAAKESGGGSNAGAIAGAVVVVLLVLCGGGGFYYYMRKKNMTCEDIMMWLPDIPGFSKRNRKDEDAEKTADIEKAAYGDDDDDYGFGAEPSPTEKGDIEFKYGDEESEGFSVMDQDRSQSGHEDDDAPGGGKSNKFKFGLGKKKAAAGTFDGGIGDMVRSKEILRCCLLLDLVHSFC